MTSIYNGSKMKLLFSDATALVSCLMIFLVCFASSCTSERVAEEIPRFNHVVLYVSDMERSIAFYSEALGLEIHQRINEFAIVADDGESQNVVPVNMTLMRLPGSQFIYEIIENQAVYESPIANTHFQHIGIEVTDIEVALAWAVSNGAMDATPIRTIHAGDVVTKTVFFKGPDGEQIEFMQILEGDY